MEKKTEEAWAESNDSCKKWAPTFFQKKRKKQKQRTLFYYELLFLFLSFFCCWFVSVYRFCVSKPQKERSNIACRQGTLNTSERRPTTNRFSLAFFLYKFTISSLLFIYLFTCDDMYLCSAKHGRVGSHRASILLLFYVEVSFILFLKNILY